MNRALVLVVLVGLAACAEVPDLPIESPLSVSTVDGRFEVEGPGFTMRFGNNSIANPQIPMPESLRIDGQEVLSNLDGCNLEALIGLALFPGLNITAAPDHLGPEGEIVSASITQTIDGPGAVQFVVEYEAQIRADGGTETFAGSSTFTFFATGRIVRRDQLTPFQRPQLLSTVAPFGCSGGPAGGFFLTSYWAFDVTSSVIVDGPGEDIEDDDVAACTIYEDTGAGIAVAFPAGSMTRYGRNGTASHILDFITQNSSMIDNQSFDLVSTAQIGTEAFARSDCGGLLSDLDDLPLFINGIDFTTNENGVYSDDTNHENTVVTITSNGEVLPRGSAIILNTGESTHAVVSREPEGSFPVAFVQRLDETLTLFVLQDGIGRDDEITIELF